MFISGQKKTYEKDFDLKSDCNKSNRELVKLSKVLSSSPVKAKFSNQGSST